MYIAPCFLCFLSGLTNKTSFFSLASVASLRRRLCDGPGLRHVGDHDLAKPKHNNDVPYTIQYRSIYPHVNTSFPRKEGEMN